MRSWWRGGFSAGYHINHLAGVFLRNIYGHLLHGFTFHSVYFLHDNLRLTHLQFVALATHGLYKHGKMKNATAKHCPEIVALTFRHAKRQVAVELTGEAVGYMT